MRPLTEDVRTHDLFLQFGVLCNSERVAPKRVPLRLRRELTCNLCCEETKQVFEKLFKYIGKSIKALIDRTDEPHCLRLHKNRVFYVRESLMRRATNVSRDKLISLGSCLGKFTHSGKFRLTIGALDILSAHAKYKVWVRPAAEMQFLYGNHVLKSGLGRITEATAAYTGVVVYSMADVPLGFGVAAKSTQDCRNLEPSGIVVLHQADVGEYLRSEDDL